MTITDPYLTDLFQASSDEDLIPIRDYILSAVTNTLDIDDDYKAKPDQPTTYIDKMVSEIRLYGGNTIVNLFRGDGVEYSEIVADVGNKISAEFEADASVMEKENAILRKILEEAIKKMSPEDLADMEEAFREAGLRNVNICAGMPVGMILAQIGINTTGFAAYQTAVIVANAVAKRVLGRGLTFAGNAALTRTIAIFTGPVGLTISGLWTLIDIAGPAYRVTIPVVAHVAFLRQKREYESILPDDDLL